MCSVRTQPLVSYYTTRTASQAEWRLLGLGVARLHALPLFQQLGADDLKLAILHPVVVNVNDHVVKLRNKGGGERIHHEIDARLGRREQHDREQEKGPQELLVDSRAE